MAVKYVLQDNPPKRDGTPAGQHARFVSEKTIDSDKLAEKASAGSTLPPELMKMALTRLVDQLKISMAQGCRIHIDGLGSFSPSLSISYSDDKRVKRPIVKANDVNFSAEADVKRYLATILTIEEITPRRSLKNTKPEELDDILRTHFEENESLTRAEFQRLCPGLTRNASCEYLKQCVAEKKLKMMGSANSPSYMKGNL